MAAPDSASPRSNFRTVARIGLAGLAFVVCVVLVSVSVLAVQGQLTRPDPDSAPEKARALAAWAGFPDTGKMKPVAFRRGDLGGDGWDLAWEGTPEQADRLMRAGAVTAPVEPCGSASTPDVHGDLAGCQQARQRWARPDGNVIDLTVMRGHSRGGATVVHLHVTDPD
jgi:hypothetical protein